MFEDVLAKYKRKNEILFSRDSACLYELIELIKKQNHRTIVLWALHFAKEAAGRIEQKYPDDTRPSEAVRECTLWSEGKIKMPQAKRAILNVHAMAKEIDDKEYAALCHAVGQGCGSVHVETHAVGFAFYELTAIVRRYGIENFEAPVSKRIGEYIEKLLFFERTCDSEKREWADFLLKDRPNKEFLLSLKKK